MGKLLDQCIYFHATPTQASLLSIIRGGAVIALLPPPDRGLLLALMFLQYRKNMYGQYVFAFSRDIAWDSPISFHAWQEIIVAPIVTLNESDSIRP